MHKSGLVVGDYYKHTRSAGYVSAYATRDEARAGTGNSRQNLMVAPGNGYVLTYLETVNRGTYSEGHIFEVVATKVDPKAIGMFVRLDSLAGLFSTDDFVPSGATPSMTPRQRKAAAIRAQIVGTDKKLKDLQGQVADLEKKIAADNARAEQLEAFPSDEAELASKIYQIISQKDQLTAADIEQILSARASTNLL